MSDETNTVTDNSTVDTANQQESIQPTFDIEALAKMDPEWLLQNHKGLQGTLGVKAQALAAKELRQNAEKAEAFRKQVAEKEMISLAKEDPEIFAKEWLSTRLEEEKQKQNLQVREQLENEFAETLADSFESLYDLPLLAKLRDTGDAEVKRRLDWRNYKDIKGMFHGMLEVALENGVKSSELEKAIGTIERRENIASDSNLGGANLGSQPTVGRYTAQQIHDMSIEEYLANEKKILNQIG